MTTERDRVSSVSLSARLSLTYAFLVGATLLVVVGLAFHLTRLHLADALDRRLLAAVDSFQGEGGPALQVDRPDALRAAARRWLAASAFPSDQAVAIRTADGRVLTGAGGLDLRDVPGGPALLESTESRWWNLDDGSFRALTVPLVLDGSQAGTLVVGASRARDQETLNGLLRGIAFAGGLGLAFATILGVLAVRRTLRPLRRMASDVAAVESTGDLSLRVSHPGPQDEVGRLAEAFDRLLSRLEEAFASQRRFLSDASHELRTPLTVARGQLELLEEGLRGAEPRRSLALTMEELDRMRHIVDDLLLLARLDEGMPLHREPVEVELVLREALLRGMLLARRASRVEVEPDLFASADAERLLQVLTNLVTNAVRHAGEGATITLRSMRAGDRVVIEVEDDGPGISPADLPHVFDRMYRGGAARADSPGGAGLGLSIAASLTRAMGGDVTVHSEPGRGAKFSLWLPAADAVDTEPLPAV